MTNPLKVFCCCAPEDHEIHVQLRRHLASLQRDNRITIWSNADLNAGVEWQEEYNKHLESADIILLLISSDFIYSDYCYSTEMQAITRHEACRAVTIPILIRPTLWEHAPFAKLQIIPTGAKAVTTWPNQDEAYCDIAQHINRIVSTFPDFLEGKIHLPLDNSASFAGERTKQEIKEQRRQFCVPLLTSLHELAPSVAQLREAHDNLWIRRKFLLQGSKYAEQVNALGKKAQERAARAGSELSIDPEGKKVSDALLEYLKAKDEYVQAMLQPLRKVHTNLFGKTDIRVLDELAKIGDDKLTALEEAIRLYVNQI
ncbi:MAG TPA: toll/interleukin-1 receptor domain-containing protein [Ktedonobacteraceae bacterium]|jgi:hypothetical protein